MNVQLRCPLCQGLFQATPEMCGQPVACPQCGGVVLVPAQRPVEAASTLAPPVTHVPPVAVVPAAPNARAAALSPQHVGPPPPRRPAADPDMQAAAPTPRGNASTDSSSNRPILAPEPTEAVEADIVIPTEDGDTVAIRDRAKTIEHRGQTIKLRQLSPEEKARMRFWRNVLMWIVSAVILFGVALLLVYGWR